MLFHVAAFVQSWGCVKTNKNQQLVVRDMFNAEEWIQISIIIAFYWIVNRDSQFLTIVLPIKRHITNQSLYQMNKVVYCCSLPKQQLLSEQNGCMELLDTWRDDQIWPDEINKQWGRSLFVSSIKKREYNDHGNPRPWFLGVITRILGV